MAPEDPAYYAVVRSTREFVVARPDLMSPPRRHAARLLVILPAFVVGCGDEKPPGAAAPVDRPDADVAPIECVDEDGDGFTGKCLGATDCDDADPAITTECRLVCGEADEGCPCAAEGDVAECKVYFEERNGVKSCFVGARVCTDGKWGTCGNLEPATAPDAG